MSSRRLSSLGRIATGAALVVTLGVWLSLGPTVGARAATSQSTEPPVGAKLTARFTALFADIRHDDLARARALFFPESAYVAMKTGQIPDPSADYVDRLLAFYQLDLAAYQRFIFSGATVSLVGVHANASLAAWIAPGVCENSIGYWHVPGVRLVYRRAGVVRSVAIDSLISWRGVWYVVHLGPNPRPVNVGTVDLPARGPGVPGPGGGC